VFELHWRTTAWVHLTLSMSPEEGSIQMCLSILSDGLAFANKQFIIKKETKDASDLTRTRPPFLWLATVTPSHMPSTISVDCAGRETHSINTSVCPKRAFLYIWIWTMRWQHAQLLAWERFTNRNNNISMPLKRIFVMEIIYFKRSMNWMEYFQTVSCMLFTMKWKYTVV